MNNHIIITIVLLVSMTSLIGNVHGKCVGNLPRHADGSCGGLDITNQRYTENESGLVVNEEGFYENQSQAYDFTLKAIINKSGITIPSYLHPTTHQLEQIVDEINTGGYPYKILSDMRNELIAKQELAKGLP